MSGPIQALGHATAGESAYAAGKFNKQMAERNARETQKETSEAEQRVRSQARAIAGEAVAMQGASGFQIGTGSALETLRETAINSELDVLTTRRQGREQATALRVSGALAMMQGKAARIAGYVAAAGDLAKTAEKASKGGSGGK